MGAAPEKPTAPIEAARNMAEAARIRIAHILLKCQPATGVAPSDPQARRAAPADRTQADGEAQLLKLMEVLLEEYHKGPGPMVDGMDIGWGATATKRVSAKFAELAREHSDCKSATNGSLSDLGWINQGQHGKDRKGSWKDQFDAVAFELPVGGLSDIIVTQRGVHVLLRRISASLLVGLYERQAGLIHLHDTFAKLFGCTSNDCCKDSSWRCRCCAVFFQEVTASTERPSDPPRCHGSHRDIAPSVMEDQEDHRSREGVWKRNEKLVYLSNFLHMTMYTMCFGGIFDIFLYQLSQEQQVIFDDPIAVGGASGHPPVFRVNTYSTFELSFYLNPSQPVSYPPGSNCSTLYTCGTSILHITDGSGIPFAYFANGTTMLHITMDALGQNETLDRRSYSKLQHCSAPKELPLHQWTKVKLKASGVENSKGKIEHSDGGMIMFINEEKVCEVPGTAYHTLPSRQGALLFLGSLQSPPLRTHDEHLPAMVDIQSARQPRCGADEMQRWLLLSLLVIGYTPLAKDFLGTSQATGGAGPSLVRRRAMAVEPKAPDRSSARLTYFAGYGLAEQTRWIMAAAGIPFEQVALQSHEDFLQMRSDGKLLFGQLPLLEIDGLKLVQSQAMLRYVAMKGNLWGQTPEESALVDMVAEGIKDARGVVVSFPFQPDKAALAAEVPQRRASDLDETSHAAAVRTSKQLEPLEALLRTRPDGSLGILASGLSAADVLLAELTEELLEIRPDAMAAYPKVAALHKQVTSLPQIRGYLDGPKRYPFPKGAEGEMYLQNVNTVLGR
eukprot:g13429.t1